ncbi:MAG: hypothetical protein EU550_00495 [Promethearchaeota archaeon]|nr:MAG: hypothetical protein EU550_00495 [Candidatus Lokiarchaeota archaeon]
MPLTPEHIEQFFYSESDSKTKNELLELLNERIKKLCFEECERDRILCTLSPMCSKRFLLKLRMLNGLTIEDQPKFCYSVHKNIIQRDFRNKTVIYKPFDSYLYLIDFLDVFFHGDYRKLNKFLSKGDITAAIEIFEDRINNRDEEFQYLLTMDKNYLIFRFDEKLHVGFLKEKIALCNANRDKITDLEILKGLTDLFSSLFFPEIERRLIPNDYLEIVTYIPKDVLNKTSQKPPEDENNKNDQYLWNTFSNDLDALSQFCKEINLYMDKKDNLKIKLHLDEKSDIRYRDLRLVFNIIFRLYNDFYIIWV